MAQTSKMIVVGFRGMPWTQVACVAMLLLFLVKDYTADGGMCFQHGENGHCKWEDELSHENRTGCCRTRGNFYLDKDLANFEIFAMFLKGGVNQCMPCDDPPSTKLSPAPKICDGVVCSREKHCIVRHDEAICVCKRRCKKSPAKPPVCGTDGVTYHNECHLNKKMCIKKKVHLKVAYDGTCRDNCTNVTCREQGKTCVIDQNKRSHCISCDSLCTNTSHAPICGTDGVTYNNSCNLRVMVCKSGKTIGIAYDQPCQNNALCSTIKCKNAMKCVTDDNGRPRCIDCTCSFGKFYIPLGKAICGMDNITYGNYCQVRAASCHQGRYIGLKHLGPCQGTVSYIKQLPSDQPDPGLHRSPNPVRRTISIHRLLEILKKLGFQVKISTAPGGKLDSVLILQKRLDIDVLVHEIKNGKSSG